MEREHTEQNTALTALQAQLDRVEAQLAQQAEQNTRILRAQRLRLVLTCLLAAALCVAVVLLWRRVDAAMTDIQQASAEVEQLAGQVEAQLNTLDPEALNALLQQLPGLTQQLNDLDVDAVNEALRVLPDLMNTVKAVQEKVEGIQQWFGNLGSGFSNGLGSWFGG